MDCGEPVVPKHGDRSVLKPINIERCSALVRSGLQTPSGADFQQGAGTKLLPSGTVDVGVKVIWTYCRTYLVETDSPKSKGTA